MGVTRTMVFGTQPLPPTVATTQRCFHPLSLNAPHTTLSPTYLLHYILTQKRLAGNEYIVQYIDSHAARNSNGPGYEVFLLMEYCSRNGLRQPLS